MFTGIVQEVGRVKDLTRVKDGARLKIEAPLTVEKLEIGDSVCTAGACLTCTSLDHMSFTADLSDETIRLTTLKNIKRGDGVNLELALSLSSRLGGHLVTGHVDGVGIVTSVEPTGEGKVITFDPPESVLRYIIPKGSVTIDGVSLTVASVNAGLFSVALIPHTLDVTTLHKLKRGDEVNMEADLIGKYIDRLLINYRGQPAATGRHDPNTTNEHTRSETSLKRALMQAGHLLQ